LTALKKKHIPSQKHIIRRAINDMPPRGDKSALKRSRVRRITDTYTSKERIADIGYRSQLAMRVK
jgi:hypothetical protein